MLECDPMFVIFHIVTLTHVCYVFLMVWIDEYNINGGAEEQVELGTAAINSTKMWKVSERFQMSLPWFVPEDEYFDVPLSTVRRQSPLLDCDFRLQFGEPTCVKLLYYFLTSVLFALAYFVSQAISDARRLLAGSYVGILAAAAMACVIVKALHFDIVRQDWWYSYPVLAHFATLVASFWTVVLLHADFVGCVHRLEQDETYSNFALLPPADISTLFYPCVCILGALAVVPFLKGAFAHHELECVGFCWLADSSLYISLHTPILVFAMYNTILFLPTNVYYQQSLSDETVETVYDAYCKHFATFGVLSLLWYLGAFFSLLGHKTLWHLMVTFVVLATVGWSLRNPFEEGLMSIFVYPFTFDSNNLANPYFNI